MPKQASDQAPSAKLEILINWDNGNATMSARLTGGDGPPQTFAAKGIDAHKFGVSLVRKLKKGIEGSAKVSVKSLFK